jgi:hypothetical protein
MITRTCVLAFLTLLATLPTPLRATEYDFIEIPTGTVFSDTPPALSGTRIAWGALIDSKVELYLFDGNDVVQLTDNDRLERFVKIDGGNIVWSAISPAEDEEIWFHDGTTAFPLTDNALTDTRPRLSGANVVWEGNVDPNSIRSAEVFFSDGLTTLRLTNTLRSENFPRVTGNRAVWDRFDGQDNELFLYDGNNVIQLTDDEVDQLAPEISNEAITWHTRSDLSDFILYYDDGESVTQLSDRAFVDARRDPGNSLSGGNVAWRARYLSGIEIFFFDGQQTLRLTDDGRTKFTPRVSGDQAVWRGYDGFDYEIFLFDGESVIQLTNNSADDDKPQISDGNVAWVRRGSANDTIVLATPRPIPTLEELFNDLLAAVESLNAQQGIQNSLDAKAQAARRALEDFNDNNNGSAVNRLEAFINEVEAQRGLLITSSEASALIGFAQEIIDSLLAA